MPKPRKDFGSAFAKEIRAQDARIVKEIAQRKRLEQAYVVITGDAKTFKERPWEPASRIRTPRASEGT